MYKNYQLDPSPELYDIEISIASYINIKFYFEENLANVAENRHKMIKRLPKLFRMAFPCAF